jgi:hypothetical protein
MVKRMAGAKLLQRGRSMRDLDAQFAFTPMRATSWPPFRVADTDGFQSRVAAYVTRDLRCDVFNSLTRAHKEATLPAVGKHHGHSGPKLAHKQMRIPIVMKPWCQLRHLITGVPWGVGRNHIEKENVYDC